MFYYCLLTEFWRKNIYLNGEIITEKIFSDLRSADKITN